MIRLVCSNGEVCAAKNVLEKMDLFRRHPNFFRNPFYELQCKARVATVGLLLTKAYDPSEQIAITEDNFEELQTLSHELGFFGLTDELRTFASANSQFSTNREIEERVNDISRENTAFLRLFSMHQKMFSDFMQRCPKLEHFNVLEKKIQELENKIDKVASLCEQKILRESRKTELALEACARKMTVDQLALDVALLKERESRHDTEIRAVQTLPKQLLYDSTTPLDGIISYLSRVCGGNVHENKIVNITSSSFFGNYEAFVPQNAADLGNDSLFWSEDKKGSWISYDFKDRRVGITSYSLKSGVGPTGGEHLRSWVIEVSNDGTEGSWREIDCRIDNYDLNGPLAMQNFKIPQILNESFRFVRLKGLGNHKNYHSVLISSLEFFGTLVEK